MRNIAEGAFCWCMSLETVRYGGTLEQWYEIDDDSLLVCCFATERTSSYLPNLSFPKA